MRSVMTCILLAFLILGNSGKACAWGPITHAEINRQASGESYSSAYVNGGHSPDIIALYNVTTGDCKYDYGHNPYGGNTTAFGEILRDVVGRTKHPERYSKEDAMFAAGWMAHQLADSVAHGSDGYVVTKIPFEGSPESFRCGLAHGVAELLVDAIVLEEFSSGPLQIAACCHAELIHEASVMFYNEHVRDIDRGSIISCSAVEHLTYMWEGWLETHKYLAQLARSQPWFDQAKAHYADFKAYFDCSVDLVRGSVARASLMDMLLEPLTGDVAYANSEEPPEAGYYRFVLAVSERARELGNGAITSESLSLALREVITGDLKGQKSDEVKVWAKLMQEMYLKDNKNWDDVVKNTEQYAQKIDKQSRKTDERGSKGPYGGSEGTEMYWLLPIGAMSVAVALLVGIFRSR